RDPRPTRCDRAGPLVARTRVGPAARRLAAQRTGVAAIMTLRRHAAVAGSAGTRWDVRADVRGAPYLPKWKPDAFCNPRLQELLAGHGIEQVVLAGLYAGACVSATAKGALAGSARDRPAGRGGMPV